jgi:putative aldouronate transport system permease protein
MKTELKLKQIKSPHNITFIQAIKKYKSYYLMLIPGLVFVTIFLYLPIMGNFIAFKNYKIFLGPFGSPWSGLDNFARLFQNGNFAQIMKNTLIISFYKIAIGFPVPIILALLLNEVQNSHFKKSVQTIVYLPHFISWVVIASLSITLLSPNDGFINGILEVFNKKPIFFLGDSKYFRGVLVATDIWKEMGWSAIIYLAALAGVPVDMYEAATIDGASKLQKIFYITIPFIIPTIVIMLLLRVGGILNAGFEQVFTMYNPAVYDVADIIDTYVYRIGIVETKYGFSAAAGLFKSILACIMVVSCNSLSKKIGQESLF